MKWKSSSTFFSSDISVIKECALVAGDPARNSGRIISGKCCKVKESKRNNSLSWHRDSKKTKWIYTILVTSLSTNYQNTSRSNNSRKLTKRSCSRIPLAIFISMWWPRSPTRRWSSSVAATIYANQCTTPRSLTISCTWTHQLTWSRCSSCKSRTVKHCTSRLIMSTIGPTSDKFSPKRKNKKSKRLRKLMKH